MFKASRTSSVLRWLVMDHPTTLRENASRTNAKYSHPSQLLAYVMSANPEVIGGFGDKVALDQVRRGGSTFEPVPAGGACPPATATADETRFSHQPRYPLPSAPDPRDAQLSINPRSAVGSPAIPVDALSMRSVSTASAFALSEGVLTRQA